MRSLSGSPYLYDLFIQNSLIIPKNMGQRAKKTNDSSRNEANWKKRWKDTWIEKWYIESALHSITYKFDRFLNTFDHTWEPSNRKLSSSSISRCKSLGGRKNWFDRKLPNKTDRRNSNSKGQIFVVIPVSPLQYNLHVLCLRVIFFFNNQIKERNCVDTLSDFFSHTLFINRISKVYSAGIHNGRDPHKELANVRRRRKNWATRGKNSRGEGRKVGEVMINRLRISNHLCFEISKAN